MIIPKQAPKQVHTVDARDCTLMPVIRDSVPSTNFQELIWGLAADLADQLRGHGLFYDDLRGALTPTTGRAELCLLFDSGRLSDMYGKDVADIISPAISHGSSHALKVGDIGYQTPEWSMETLRGSLGADRVRDIKYPNQVYAVYLSNLTSGMQEGLINLAEGCPGFLAGCDMRFNSSLRDLLAISLAQVGIIHRGHLLAGNPDSDRIAPDEAPVFLDYGLKVLGIPDFLYCPLLNYKIPTSVAYDPDDTEFAYLTLDANGARGVKSTLDNVAVLIQQGKFEKYLHAPKHKLESLKNAGLDGLTRTELENVVRAAVDNSYLFNFRRNEHGNLLCSTRIEIPRGERDPYLAIVGLEYQVKDQTMRLTTLF